MFWPCETRTSTCRSFATISSGLYRFLAIAVLLDVKDIPQVGPLQWGWITYTDTAIKTLAGIMMEQTSPPMARIVAAKVLLDRGWGKPKEMHHSGVDDNKTLLKVVNEIVHVHETREQIEFRDQTPLLELTPEDTDA